MLSDISDEEDMIFNDKSNRANIASEVTGTVKTVTHIGTISTDSKRNGS